MLSLDNLLQGLLSNQMIVSQFPPKDRKALVDYFGQLTKKNPEMLPSFQQLIDALDLKKVPYNGLFSKIIKGQVAKVVLSFPIWDEGIEKAEAIEDIEIIELIFSLDFFNSKELDGLRKKIADKKAILNDRAAA